MLSKQDTTDLFSLAGYLQHKLNVPVTLYEFVPVGLWWSTAWPDEETTAPCSLITIEPFVPCGFRRLVLNINAPLIHDLAKALKSGHSDTVYRMGVALIRSASWPVKQVDTQVAIHWKATPGVIACPDDLVIPPVPHHEMTDPIDEDPRDKQSGLSFPRLAIWPLRVHSVDKPKLSEDKAYCMVTRVQTLWDQRDEGLYKEFTALQQAEVASCSSSRLLRWRKTAAVPKRTSNVALNGSSYLITMAPSLPVFVLAQELLRRNKTHILAAFSDASNWLLENDRLFCLSLFFGVPLMDRTRVLDQTVRVAPYSRPPPTQENCIQWRKDWLHNIKDDTTQICHKVLRRVMLQRAQKLWKEADGSSILVAWSGGIDSTAALCALLETTTDQTKVEVLLDDESIAENPRFYQHQIKDLLKTRRRDGQPLSTHASNWDGLMVTGELGDQLFGSAKLKAAFGPDEDSEIPAIWVLPFDVDLDNTSEKARDIFQKEGLDAPWETTILPVLDMMHLLGGGTSKEWAEWIRPQLEVSPIPIKSTFDFLWWINFSCKWQNVCLRCLHDGGTPMLHQSRNIVSGLTGCIRHFFDDYDLECWSCLPEFHHLKFPDLQSWPTYKEPLKHFIKQFDGDDEYYTSKTKVGSLSFGAPRGPSSYTNHFYGAVVHMENPTSIHEEDEVQALLWGLCGMVDAPMELSSLMNDRLCCNLLQNKTKRVTIKIETGDLDDNSQECEPRAEDNLTNAPSRKSEVVARCAAVLDNAFCLGRSVLYASSSNPTPNPLLFHGSSSFTSLYCPENGEVNVLLERLKTCKANSFDIAICEGVLDHVTDPCSTLMELMRVSAHSILVDMQHPEAWKHGFYADPTETDTTDKVRYSKTSSLQVRQCTEFRMSAVGFQRTSKFSRTMHLEGNDGTWLLSRAAVESLMLSKGWKVKRILLTSAGLENTEGTGKYLEPLLQESLPERFLLLCTKQFQEEKPTDAFLIPRQFAAVSSPFLSWEDFSSQTRDVMYSTTDEDPSPFSMTAWDKDGWSGGKTNCTIYGYVYEGPAELSLLGDDKEGMSFNLYSGMYFSCPGRARISHGCGVLQLVDKYNGLFSIGGPVAAGPGRLLYIDGCTDTLLIPPVVYGAPCLNHLHFPRGVSQTQHTHPSGRSGVVVRGSGVCRCNNGSHSVELSAGVAFVIPTDVVHAFETTEREGMDVIAFHPDSDFGPTANNHPMVNRTIVDGVSASKLDTIRTRRLPD